MLTNDEARRLCDELEDLCAGGGVTVPDDMIYVDSAKDCVVNLIADGKRGEHLGICNELNDLYARKNRDYGDSFSKSYEKYGPVMALIRLEDKLNRASSLVKNGGSAVKDESLRDTIIDMANYAIMTVMEMDRAWMKKISE